MIQIFLARKIYICLKFRVRISTSQNEWIRIRISHGSFISIKRLIHKMGFVGMEFFLSTIIWKCFVETWICWFGFTYFFQDENYIIYPLLEVGSGSGKLNYRILTTGILPKYIVHLFYCSYWCFIMEFSNLKVSMLSA